MIPFLNLGLASSFISTIKIPEFINEFILQNPFLFSLFNILVISLSILLLRWIYSIHYFVLEDVSFNESKKRSISLGKKCHTRDWFCSACSNYFLFATTGYWNLNYRRS